MTIEYKNVKRIVAADRASLDQYLDPKMIGFEKAGKSIGAKDDVGNTYWYVAEGEAAIYSGVKVTNFESLGSENRIVGVDEFGNLIDLGLDVRYPFDLVKDPSGFVDTEIYCSYDPATRKITLNDNGAHEVKAIWQGSEVPLLVDGWESAAHPVNATANMVTYFLYYRDGDYYWSTLPWHFSDIQIASTWTRTSVTIFSLRECHGLMQWQTHEEAHDNVGTYIKSGGGISNYTLLSTTPADRRPYLAEVTIKDEDLPTTLSALLTNAYTWGFLSGVNVTTATAANPEIVSIDVSGKPFWNEYSGGTWGQTVMLNNEYQKIYIMAVPVTDDTSAAPARYLFIQGQMASTDINLIHDLSPASVNIGDITAGSNEYVYIGEVIIRATANNWYIHEVNELSGGRYNQVASPSNPTVTYQNSLQNGNIASTDAIHSDGVKTTWISEDGIAQVELGEDLLIETNGGDVLIDNAVSTNDITERAVLGDKGFVAREDIDIAPYTQYSFTSDYNNPDWFKIYSMTFSSETISVYVDTKTEIELNINDFNATSSIRITMAAQIETATTSFTALKLTANGAYGAPYSGITYKAVADNTTGTITLYAKELPDNTDVSVRPITYKSEWFNFEFFGTNVGAIDPTGDRVVNLTDSDIGVTLNDTPSTGALADGVYQMTVSGGVKSWTTA